MAKVKSERDENLVGEIVTRTTIGSQALPTMLADCPTQEGSEMSDPYDWDLALEELQGQRRQLYFALSYNLFPCLACSKTFHSNAHLQSHLQQHHCDATLQHHSDATLQHHSDDTQQHHSDATLQHHSDDTQQHHSDDTQQHHSERIQQLEGEGLLQCQNEQEQLCHRDRPQESSIEQQHQGEQHGQGHNSESWPGFGEDMQIHNDESAKSTACGSQEQVDAGQETVPGSSLLELCGRSYCYVDFACTACQELFCTVAAWRVHNHRFHGKIPSTEPQVLMQSRDQVTRKTVAGVRHGRRSTAGRDEVTMGNTDAGVASSAQDTTQPGVQVSGKKFPFTKGSPSSRESRPELQDSIATKASQPAAEAEAEKCKYCDRSFSLKSALKRHVTRKHPVVHLDKSKKGKLALRKDGERSAQTWVSRKRSILRCGDQFQCPECRALFGWQWEAKLHLQVEHKGQSLACPSQCGIFPSMEALKQHVSDVHKDYTFTCPKCGQIFNKERQFGHHLTEMHETQKYSCSICGKDFARLWNMQHHMMIVHKKTSFKCRHCTKSFTREKHLQAHVGFVHKKGFGYRCSHCSKKFLSANQHRTHIQTVHQHVKHECSSCGKKFTQKHRLRDHEDFAHKNIIKYTCAECGKNFEQRPVFQEHVRMVHQKQYRHTCTKCPRKFVKLSALQRHVDSVHRGLRLKCPKCPKFYSTRDTLRRHAKRCHCSSFSHKCPQCALGFVHEANLHKHQLCVHQQVRWPCPQCDRHFADQSSLKAHLTKVHIKKEK